MRVLRPRPPLPSSEHSNKHLVDIARPIAEVPTTNPREDLSTLIRRIGLGLDERVLVFDNGNLVGIVVSHDVARMITIQQRSDAKV